MYVDDTLTMTAFGPWLPDSDEVICAKPEIYYQEKCFGPRIEERFRSLKKAFKGPKKLQGKDRYALCGRCSISLIAMCLNLMRTPGDCIKWFNELCSKDLLKTGRGDFTPATLGERDGRIGK